MRTKITFEVGGETIKGLIVSKDLARKPEILFLHGAGTSTKERALPIAEYFAERGASSLLFDFSGHGESSGELGSSSLAKRVLEAEAALEFFDPAVPVSLCGFSMGGHVALELLARRKVKNLALFYPGIYAAEAFGVQFDSGFSEIIRKHESWKDARVANNLRQFAGKFLVMIGEKDEVIPAGVISMLDRASSRAQKKEIVRIPGADHLFLAAALADPVSREALCAKAAEYVID